MKAGTEVRDEVWSYVWDASMFQPWHFPMKDSLCVSLGPCTQQFVRDFKRQAAELRRTGREVARGLKRKNRWDFPRETSPLVSVALLSLFPLSTPKKLLAFEHGRDRYKLRRAALDWHSRDIYPWVQSLNPPFRPLCLISGSIQQCSPRAYLVETNHRRK